MNLCCIRQIQVEGCVTWEMTAIRTNEREPVTTPSANSRIYKSKIRANSAYLAVFFFTFSLCDCWWTSMFVQNPPPALKTKKKKQKTKNKNKKNKKQKTWETRIFRTILRCPPKRPFLLGRILFKTRVVFYFSNKTFSQRHKNNWMRKWCQGDNCQCCRNRKLCTRGAGCVRCGSVIQKPPHRAQHSQASVARWEATQSRTAAKKYRIFCVLTARKTSREVIASWNKRITKVWKRSWWCLCCCFSWKPFLRKLLKIFLYLGGRTTRKKPRQVRVFEWEENWWNTWIESECDVGFFDWMKEDVSFGKGLVFWEEFLQTKHFGFRFVFQQWPGAVWINRWE